MIIVLIEAVPLSSIYIMQEALHVTEDKIILQEDTASAHDDLQIFRRAVHNPQKVPGSEPSHISTGAGNAEHGSAARRHGDPPARHPQLHHLLQPHLMGADAGK